MKRVKKEKRIKRVRGRKTGDGGRGAEKWQQSDGDGKGRSRGNGVGDGYNKGGDKDS